MTTLERVCATLAAGRIAHALIGAAALAARGVARSTFDIDLLVADTRVLDRAQWGMLEAQGLRVDIRKGDDDDPLGGVVRIDADGQRPIDVILGKLPWHHRAVARADAVGGGPPVVQARDLVLLKLYAGGTQDLWDIRELLAQPHHESLVEAIREDLEPLGEAMNQAWLAVRSGV